MIVLSYIQVAVLFQAWQKGLACVTVSPDLGLTECEVHLAARGACFPGETWLTWQEAQEILQSNNNCFWLKQDGAHKIQFFSEQFGRVYSLYPTNSAPTMLVSGIPMHRIQETNPYQDTLEKINSVRPLVGRVLDTATGLGYTAIEAAKTVDQVTTIEVDPLVLQVARLNPWSQALFDNPSIEQRIGDSFEVIREFADGTFSRIIHDPPVISLAGDLYSGMFYKELLRVLKTGGRLFHYVGNPESKSGRNTTAGVMRRLEQAGFRGVKRAWRAFGVVATK